MLFLLIATLQGSLALSQGEETAISDLFQEWPFLGSLSPPWTSNSSEACNAPFQGLVCSDGPDQHILSLYEAKLCLSVVHFGVQHFLSLCPSLFANN